MLRIDLSTLQLNLSTPGKNDRKTPVKNDPKRRSPYRRDIRRRNRLNPRLQAIFQPIRLPPNINHMSMMEQPIQQSRGDNRIAEQFTPIAETGLS